MMQQVVHCSGSLIAALLDAGAQNYLEFKLVQERCAGGCMQDCHWQPWCPCC